MKKILYLTSIPWAWIKQRPQFLAEYLSKDYEVTYCYKRPTVIKKKDLKTNITDLKSITLKFKSFRIIPFRSIPIIKKLKLEWINRFLLKFQIPNPDNYDIIWVTSATLFDLLPNYIKKQPNIVYDCMDDLLEFPLVQGSESKRALLMRKENRLLIDSKLVISSADYLKNKIVSRSGIPENKVCVINNAIELPKIEKHTNLPNEVCGAIDIIKNIKLSMIYIGTIDEWFDFDSINYVLDKTDGLELVLFGPLRGTLPDNKKIHYLGTVQRDYIFDIMEAADILVMPFKLNELIRSVNPVKLYEYIYAGKHVIATKYGETMKFEKYAHLYEDKEDFLKIINTIKSNNCTVNIDSNLKYVQDNTWNNRYTIVKNVLENEF